MLRWSLSEMAERSGVSRQTIHRLERGTRIRATEDTRAASEEAKQAIALALWRAGLSWEHGALRYDPAWDATLQIVPPAMQTLT